MCAHMVQVKLKQKQKLQALLHEAQTENRKLETRLCQARKNLLSTQQRIDTEQQNMKMVGNDIITIWHCVVDLF